MRNAREILDSYYLEMRWRCLSLAADLDRVERAEGGADLLKTDPRIARLREALETLKAGGAARAQAVQNVFSDHTPPPPYNASVARPDAAQ
jgi:hypothetical protein